VDGILTSRIIKSSPLPQLVTEINVRPGPDDVEPSRSVATGRSGPAPRSLGCRLPMAGRARVDMDEALNPDRSGVQAGANQGEDVMTRSGTGCRVLILVVALTAVGREARAEPSVTR
jgi:hypothetical protein